MSKNKFIKLHTADDNEVCVFNTKEIVAVYVENETTIYTLTDEEETEVNETPDKIFNSVSDSFIKLHKMDGNTVCLVNVEHIIRCINDDDHSTVYLKDGLEIEVNETSERVFNAIIKVGAPQIDDKKRKVVKQTTETEKK